MIFRVRLLLITVWAVDWLGVWCLWACCCVEFITYWISFGLTFCVCVLDDEVMFSLLFCSIRFLYCNLLTDLRCWFGMFCVLLFVVCPVDCWFFVVGCILVVYVFVVVWFRLITLLDDVFVVYVALRLRFVVLLEFVDCFLILVFWFDCWEFIIYD